MTKRKGVPQKKIEILAPAGSLESLKAAVCAGADAVYVGGSRFGARAYADNFGEQELLAAIDYVHLHGRKIYMTVNTLLKDQEVEELYKYLLPYYCQGLDAVIVQDTGVLSLIREWFPGLGIHISTQMTVTGTEGAEFFKAQGAERIVPARELSLEEIRSMKKETGLEIECFVHGAMCYCYSGQCLMSSMIGGRSGNRGQCAQPCRLSYSVERQKPRELMSLKDLCTIDMIPELIEAGIDSFKIEGRMKQPDYVYIVVSMYRKYADLYLAEGAARYQVSAQDRKVLEGVYQRRGYSSGYYKQHNGKNMISTGRVEDGIQEVSNLANYKIKEKINGKLILSEGNRAKLDLNLDEIQVSVLGDVVQTAKNQPLQEERIRKQMNKTGETEVEFEKLEVRITGNIFLPMQVLNELRRQGIEALEEAIVQPWHRQEPVRQIQKEKLEDVKKADREGRNIEERQSISKENKLRLTAFVSDHAQCKTALGDERLNAVYVESNLIFDKGIRELCNAADKKVYAALPYICRHNTMQYMEQNYPELVTCYDGVLVRNYESLQWLVRHGYDKEIIGDYNLYVFNTESKEFLKKQGVDQYTASVELNDRELQRLDITDGVFIAYGYQPVMITANCVKKNTEGCKKQEAVLHLTDRRGKKFAVKNYCKYCYNVIYNPIPLMLLHQAEEIRRLCPAEIRLDFVTESAKEMKKIADLYAQIFLDGKQVEIPAIEYTKGHFKRGVK